MVVIEQQQAHFESDAPVVAPVIRIERQILESSARNVHEYVLPLDAVWEFPRTNLDMGNKASELMCNETSQISLILCDLYSQVLGTGNFGKVMQATASDIINKGETTTVAVKMLKEGHSDQAKSDYFRLNIILLVDQV